MTLAVPRPRWAGAARLRPAARWRCRVCCCRCHLQRCCRPQEAHAHRCCRGAAGYCDRVLHAAHLRLDWHGRPSAMGALGCRCRCGVHAAVMASCQSARGHTVWPQSRHSLLTLLLSCSARNRPANPASKACWRRAPRMATNKFTQIMRCADAALFSAHYAISHMPDDSITSAFATSRRTSNALHVAARGIGSVAAEVQHGFCLTE